MSIAGAIVTLLCSWWIFFLMLLPWGLSHERSEGATAFGAPARTGLSWKAIGATLAASLFTFGLFFADWIGLFDLTYVLSGAR